jgi:hypothetical protein
MKVMQIPLDAHEKDSSIVTSINDEHGVLLFSQHG